MKKSFFYIFIGVVGLISLVQAIRRVIYIPYILPNYIDYYKNTGSNDTLLYYIITLVILLTINITLFSVSLWLIIKAIKGSNASNFVRYTYEEYKEYRANKKAQKQADKKAKLQAELNKMEKAE